jgi:RimJ/RimL family protein N-acetyltransferase
MSDTIDTDRLHLRRFTLEDAEAMTPLVTDPEVLRYTGERPLTSIEAVRDLLTAKQLRDYRVHGYGRMAVIEKASGRLIGFSGLKRLEHLDETDVGYRFVRDAWGKGYATESASAVMAAMVPALGLKRLIGRCDPANAASAHVLRKLGMSWEARTPDDDCHGEVDVYAMAIE